MKDFGRALKLALAHRVNVAGCILTAIVVALLWGGNLTAVFPVVEIIMNDSSLPQWVDAKATESQREIADNQRWLGKLERLNSDDVAQAKRQIATELLQSRAGP